MPTLEQVLEKYPDDVKLVVKNFPLRNHKYAMKAASAAMAADAQGKFWEFHDLLFKHYKKLSDQKVKEIVTELAMDEAAFEVKLKDPQINQHIRRDLMDGVGADVRGTPTIFINGRVLKDRSLGGFRKVISKELREREKAQ